MKKEFRHIKEFSKNIISKLHHKKLSKIKDEKERTEGLKYLVTSKLKVQLLEFELSLQSVPKKEALLVESLISQLRSKIRIFESTHKKRDFEIAQGVIEKIKKELPHV